MRLSPRSASVCAGIGCATCISWSVAGAGDVTATWLVATLLVAAGAANIASAYTGGHLSISGAFIAEMLAVAFLAPAAAFAVVAIGELAAWFVERSRPRVLAANITAAGLPILATAEVFRAVSPASDKAQFYLLLAGLSVGVFVLNFVLAHTFLAGFDQRRWRDGLAAETLDLLPSIALNIVLAVAAASVYVEVGTGGLVFALASIVTFTYMASLVAKARDRARRYAALSWGVLSGLLRALDTRDPRAARHSAATAAFARDIARQCGMDARTCELAHTAGLLHDVGRLALADRVLDQGRTLGEEDWESIRHHPQLGAEMLQDLGVYGPVAEIVHAHHERIDGRGYPDGLADDAIPELAKIVAVAEVYDTLTAEDTYRTQVSSFEALTELRRVSGSQLDGRYVEALATLLSGRGVEYRHASAADFEHELDMERRIGDAATG